MHRLWSLLLVVLLATCGTDPDARHRVSRGGKHYGGIFNMNETEALRGFFPLQLTQASAHRIAAQIYQGLVKVDPQELGVRPCLAEHWEVDSSATIWTFHLRKGVRFHDDPAFTGGEGREVTADDVVNCLTAVCTGGKENQMFWLLQDRVLGANEHHAATPNGQPLPEGVKGLKVIDERTVRITLAHPVPNFLQVIAHQGCWIWPRELMDAYGGELFRHGIGTGPFRLKAVRVGEAMVMERNPHYWERDEHGDPLPFLDGVRVTFVNDKIAELEAFLKGDLTCMIDPPVERLSVLRDTLDASGARRFVVLSVPAFSSQFFGFNIGTRPFNDRRVRRAFSLAIDREALVATALAGLAVPAQHGLVPPGLPGYPLEQVTRTGFFPDSARALLAAAGYPGGVGFPNISLQVNGDGFGYVQVADAVQMMLERVLGVSVSVSVLPADQHYAMVDAGHALFWRQGWIADYPDAENFLALLYGKNAVLDTSQNSPMNTSRYADPFFDSLYALAQRTTDEHKRAQLMAQAESRAMDEAVVAPIYHERALRLQLPQVRDLPINAMGHRDLSAVWFDPSAMPR